MKKLRDGIIYITMKISCRGRDRGYNLTNRMIGEVARVVGFGHDNGNSLSYLPSMLLTSFSDWYRLEVINLQDNPWKCNCHNEWMFKTIVPWIYNKTPELLEGL